VSGANDTASADDIGGLPPADPVDLELGNPGAQAATPGRELEPSPEEKKRLEALGVAAVLLEVGAQISARVWPELTFTGDEKRQGAEVLGPVLAKYDVGSAFLDAYKEELALAAFAFGLYTAKRAELEEKRELARKRAEEERANRPGAQS
jgi:hypothetical protein